MVLWSALSSGDTKIQGTESAKVTCISAFLTCWSVIYEIINISGKTKCLQNSTVTLCTSILGGRKWGKHKAQQWQMKLGVWIWLKLRRKWNEETLHEKEWWAGIVALGKFLWQWMILSHVPIGHWDSGFKRPSSAEIKFLGAGSVDATTQRKRELCHLVTLGETSSRQIMVSRDTLFLKPGVSSLTPWLNLAPCLQKWLVFSFPMTLSLCQVVI